VGHAVATGKARHLKQVAPRGLGSHAGASPAARRSMAA
jgi:hypothetical protein